MEIRKDVSLKLIFKDKDGNQYFFAILLILTWELRYVQKRGVNRKIRESFSVWEGANNLPSGRKDLPRVPGSRLKLY